MGDPNPFAVGGAVAIALALVEALKVGLVKLIQGKNGNGYGYGKSTRQAVTEAEWRRDMENYLRSQEGMQRESLKLQRKTIQALDRLTDKIGV